MNDWDAWLMEVAKGDSIRAIASKTSYSPSSISGWKSSGRPPAAAVFEIAREYGGDFLGGLMAAGWLTEQDLEAIRSRLVLGLPTRALINELHSRGERAPKRRGFYDPPTDPTRWPARGPKV